jgi:hypothetical protein
MMLANDVRCVSSRLWTRVIPGQNARTSGRPRSARIDDAVLRTTLRHLAERGYAGMSINAIAAER